MEIDLSALEKEIEKTKSKIQGFDDEIHDLQNKKSAEEKFLDGLMAAQRVLTKNWSKNFQPKKQVLRPGSELALVKTIIENAGHPLHIDDIVNNLCEEKNLTEKEWKKKKSSLVSTLNSYAALKRVFLKDTSNPNTFGLIQFNNENNDYV